MAKNITCHECLALGGAHLASCRRRGYAAVGPHPDAPPAELAELAPSTPPLEMCCGGVCVRALCFIHATEPRASAPAASGARMSRVYPKCDLNDLSVWVIVGMRGRAIFAGPLEDAFSGPAYDDAVLSADGWHCWPKNEAYR